MPADTLWTLAMALNVYLTFFHRYTASQLRSLEPLYLALNYGIPLIPATVFVCLGPSSKRGIYGDATLWCWVSPRWNALRIATFYGPIWCALLFFFFLVSV